MEFYPSCYSKHHSPMQQHQQHVDSRSSDGLDSKGRELERRLRREIANSNERRRMQSINTGFKTLKATIPHEEGEKMSKASILQNAAQYICTMRQEMDRLARQNARLTWLVGCCARNDPSDDFLVDDSKTKAKADAAAAAAAAADDPRLLTAPLIEARRELRRMRAELDRERRCRSDLEEEEEEEEEGESGLGGSSELGLPGSPASSCRASQRQQPASAVDSRGSLDTILRAIQHVEGDEVFPASEK